MSPSEAVECYPCREVPLNYSESLLFRGGDTGSTPVRDAKTFNHSRALTISPHVHDSRRRLLTRVNKKARTAATASGLTILLTVLWIYLPMLLAAPTDVVALNFFFDTLLFCGAILMLANSIEKEPARI